MKLGIFPAAGALGGSTLRHVLDTCDFDPSSLVLIARSRVKLEEYEKRGVTVREADFDKRELFEGVFEGVEVLNLISYPSFEHEHRFKVAKAAIDAAVSQGVTHIFYSSLAFSSSPLHSRPDFSPHVMLAHLDTEDYLSTLAASSTPSKPFTYTVIRQGLYSESCPVYTNNFDVKAFHLSGEKEATIRIPHDGAGEGMAWAKRDELGEATARLMVAYTQYSDTFQYTNKLVTLSGPRSYTLSETAAVFSRVTGKLVTVQEVTVDDYIAKDGKGFGSENKGSEDMNRLWATAFEGVRRGQAGKVTSDLKEWLGREPEAFEVTVKGMLI